MRREILQEEQNYQEMKTATEDKTERLSWKIECDQQSKEQQELSSPQLARKKGMPFEMK